MDRPVLPVIEINRQAEPRLERIDEDNVCVIVDDFLADPDALVDYACAEASRFEAPERSYPGLLLDVAEEAMRDIYRFIRSDMRRQFGFMKGGIRLSTYLSMATLPPGRLSPLQRLCHSDPRTQPSSRNYAALIYLFRDRELGGTGFYHWKERRLIEHPIFEG